MVNFCLAMILSFSLILVRSCCTITSLLLLIDLVLIFSAFLKGSSCWYGDYGVKKEELSSFVKMIRFLTEESKFPFFTDFSYEISTIILLGSYFGFFFEEQLKFRSFSSNLAVNPFFLKTPEKTELKTPKFLIIGVFS